MGEKYRQKPDVRKRIMNGKVALSDIYRCEKIMDSLSNLSCGKCGSRFRLDFTREVFAADADTVKCPTCSWTLFSYNEVKTYFIAETLEIRRDHEKLS